MAAAAARGADARGPAVIVYEVERVWSDSIAPTGRSTEENPSRTSAELNLAGSADRGAGVLYKDGTPLAQQEQGDVQLPRGDA